jgi:hypothetical protein
MINSGERGFGFLTLRTEEKHALGLTGKRRWLKNRPLSRIEKEGEDHEARRL